jgi:hypothetical protein
VKNIYTVAKQAIWHSEKVRLGTRKGPFGTMKRSVLEREMACMGNVLIINVIEDKRNGMRIMKYFNIWMEGRG